MTSSTGGSARKGRFVTRSARNGTPFLRIDFYSEPFWKIFFENPVNPVRIAIFESGNIGTFVRAESACIEIGSQNADQG